MKIVIAIDSFKGSLSSYEAGMAAAEGIRRAFVGGAQPEIIVKPLADGGEGTVDAFASSMGGEMCSIKVNDPLMRNIDCKYAIINESAVIEMAGAAGLNLVDKAERNPLLATTYGVGEVIRDAIGRGVRDFVIGIGGSATNDCGTGMLQALGFEFYDGEGKLVSEGIGGGSLKDIFRINGENAMKELKECIFSIACDVNNPLCGTNGASYVYGPQKGASPEMVRLLDEGSAHFASVVNDYLGTDLSETPGAGAAGGLGFAFRAFLEGTLKSGIQIVLEKTGAKESLSGADYFVTGEGCLDFQTAMGKAPVGAAKLAKELGVKTVAFSGCVSRGAEACNEQGIDAFFPIVRKPVSLEEAMGKEAARENLMLTAEQVFRLILAAA